MLPPPKRTSRKVQASVCRRAWPCEPRSRRGANGIGRKGSVQVRVQRGSQRQLDGPAEFIELKFADIRAGGRDHLGLIDRDVRDGEAFHFGRIARDETRGPSLIVVGAGCQRMPVLKNLGQPLAVGDRRQELGHGVSIVEPRDCHGDLGAHPLVLPQGRLPYRAGQANAASTAFENFSTSSSNSSSVALYGGAMMMVSPAVPPTLPEHGKTIKPSSNARRATSMLAPRSAGKGCFEARSCTNSMPIK